MYPWKGSSQNVVQKGIFCFVLFFWMIELEIQTAYVPKNGSCCLRTQHNVKFFYIQVVWSYCYFGGMDDHTEQIFRYYSRLLFIL